MPETELKSCPFCGSESGIEVITILYWQNKVECRHCGCTTCIHATKKAAIEIWNRRADK